MTEADEAAMELPEEFRLLGRVVISTCVGPNGEHLHNVAAYDADGDDLPLIESLGMAELATDRLIRQAMGEDNDEGDTHEAGSD